MKKVRVSEGSVEIPTYAWCGKDREAPLIREFTPRGQPVYPYRTLEEVAGQARPERYRSVVFENDLLELVFLPGLNGRLYSAFDKVNRRHLFYNNPQLKPALLGLRGAWCANGVEYNFPNSHTTTSLDPVMTRISRGEDGSAAFVCGDWERVGRMLWSVTVVLRPGQACIEMQTRLYNCTDYPKRFYYWLNAALPVYGETRFVFPESTTRLYTHPPMDISRIAYLDYPRHRGRDISLFRNIPQHLPLFAETMEADFFGVYHNHLGHGVIHLADRSLVRGRKIWTFGNARDGKVWIDLLTDSGTDYCEVQSGPFTLQSDYRLLDPGKMHIQQDLWMPVGDTGGFNAASETLAANIRSEGGQVRVRVSASRTITDALVVVKSEDRVIDRQPLSIKALQVKTVTLQGPRRGAYTLEILDHRGRPVLAYTPPGKDAAAGSPAPARNPGRKDRYLEGLYWEEQGRPERAYALYASDTSRDAGKAAARMDMASGRWKRAAETLGRVLRSDRQDAEALLYQGICLARSGDYRAAERSFSRCGDKTAFRDAALSQLARVSILRRNYAEARARLAELAEHGAPSAHDAALMALVSRKEGRPEAVPEDLARAERIFPFEPLATGEAFFRAGTFPREPDARMLIEILCRYLNLHEYADALTITEAYLDGDREAPAIVWYYKAYLEELSGHGARAEAARARAGRSTAEWDFIFRSESAEVLNAALAGRPGDPAILYHLGNFYAHQGRWDTALRCWRQVDGKLKPLALRGEGLYRWKVSGEREKALKAYRAAAARPGCGARTLWEYDQLLTETRAGGRTRLAVLKEHRELVADDQRLLLRKADALAAAGRAEEALEILQQNRFAVCEGRFLPRLIFENACRRAGERCRRRGDFEKALGYFMKPLAYPENLGVGKPAANMECEWYWRCGMICREAGDDTRAKEFFRKGTEPGDRIPVDFFPLKKLVWQHDPAGSNPAERRNARFRSSCFRMLDTAGKTAPR